VSPEGTLHVTNGDSVAGTLRTTSLGGDAIAWRELLHEGPVPNVPIAELRRIRSAFLSACGWGVQDEIVADLAQRHDVLTRAVAERRPVVLWFEHDLFDQLLLLQVLSVVAHAGPNPPERVQLIQIGSFPGRARFHGLGELSPEELASLWPDRRPVGGELVDLGRRSWSEVRSPTPAAIEGLSHTELPGLPFLPGALHRLLEELPHPMTGLSRSERHVLEALAARPSTPLEVFHACQERETAPFEGDASVFCRIAQLGGREPLLCPERGGRLPSDPKAFAATRLVLTPTGREVLDGTFDAVELRGIDRWLLGTHLTIGDVWRWDPVSARVVRDA
jgi:hypothetical protein